MESSQKNETLNAVLPAASGSGIRDNYLRGVVGEFLLQKIREGAPVSPQPGEFHALNTTQTTQPAGR